MHVSRDLLSIPATAAVIAHAESGSYQIQSFPPIIRGTKIMATHGYCFAAMMIHLRMVERLKKKMVASTEVAGVGPVGAPSAKRPPGVDCTWLHSTPPRDARVPERLMAKHCILAPFGPSVDTLRRCRICRISTPQNKAFSNQNKGHLGSRKI